MNSRRSITRAEVVGRLHERAVDVVAEAQARPGSPITMSMPKRLGASLQDVERLRKDVRCDTQKVFARAGGLAGLDAMQQRHRFGGRRRLVQQRCRGDLHRRQIAHHRLEVEQRFQTSLRNLGLIGRVGRVPRRILEQIPQNHAGRDGAVVAHADERLGAPVLCSHAAKPVEILVLGFGRWQLQRLLEPDAAGSAASMSASSERTPMTRSIVGQLRLVRADVPLFECVWRI